MSIEHISRGDTPSLLVLSGMHGDEYGVIPVVKEYIQRHENELPDFLYIPEVSPTAVRAHTRNNAFGHNVNRKFFDQTDDPEAQAVMSAVSPYRFDLCLDFHEDPMWDKAFYMYDTGKLDRKHLSTVREKIAATEAVLFTGIDDTDDSDLGYHVEKGYVSTPYRSKSKNAGFSARWLYTHGIVKRMFILEIPGRAPTELKRALVGELFQFFLTTPLT